VSAPRDYYEVLGVSRTAAADEIKAAHRRLAKTLHPDMNKAPDAAAKFNELQEAFGVLSDPEKRAAYDRFGHAGVGAAGPEASRRGERGRGSQSQWRHVDVGDFSEVFSEVFGGGGGGPFGEGMGGSRRAGRGQGQPAAGRDVESQIEVDFMTAALGGTRSISMEGPDGEQRFDVRIPPGI